MPCWHVEGVTCDSCRAAVERMREGPFVPAHFATDWEKIAKQLEKQLEMSMEQTRVAQQNCDNAIETAMEALEALRSHLKTCRS